MFWLEVDQDSSMPYIRQIHERLRLKILRGDLVGGNRLPSTRELADHLRVSRNVVREAYAQLAAEGYLESRKGAGMFVAKGACMAPSVSGRTVESPALSCVKAKGAQDAIDFRTGLPALEMIPRTLLAKRFREACLEIPATGYGYSSPGGHPELREALSVYLARTRGVQCSPECILITTGMSEALFITAKLLLGKNASVAVEDPMHLHFQDTLRFCGAELWPADVDESGLLVESLARIKETPAFVFVTPSHQFPFGGTLSVQRRLELLRFAKGRGCPIVEDDYESEFCYGGTAVGSLQGMDPDGVFYIGTFSKIISPSLRVGYLVLPSRFVSRAQEIKYLVNHHSATFDQLVLARLIESGELERHVAKMKKVYRKRQQELVHALADAFQDRCRCSGTSAGLYLVAAFEQLEFTPAILGALEEGGVRLYPVERHAIRKGKYANCVILCFGHLPESRIRAGVSRLRRILGSESTRH